MRGIGAAFVFSFATCFNAFTVCLFVEALFELELEGLDTGNVLQSEHDSLIVDDAVWVDATVEG